MTPFSEVVRIYLLESSMNADTVPREVVVEMEDASHVQPVGTYARLPFSSRSWQGLP